MEIQALDGLIMSDDAVVAQRARAAAKLDQITRRAKTALVDAGIDLELFLMVPRSDNAILTYGTLVTRMTPFGIGSGMSSSRCFRRLLVSNGPDARSPMRNHRSNCR